MHLFLDTNVYLSFYKLSDDDLEELRKLAVTVRSGETVLYLTTHVRDEFRRNRAGVIAESLRLVESASLPKSFPRLLTNLEGYDDLRASLNLFERQRANLLQAAREAAERKELHADALIGELFEIAMSVELTDEILSAARTRHLLGNPPGKKESIGDALNWEALLAVVPQGETIDLVTLDKDYASKLDGTKLDEYLAEEWSARKGATVTAYPSLTALFRSKYPDIRLAADLEKELAIDDLVTSGRFTSTHIAIQKLASFTDFTPAQAQTMVEAADSNSQIRLILLDDDVRHFFSDLVNR
jgi:hypothetical protein